MRLFGIALGIFGSFAISFSVSEWWHYGRGVAYAAEQPQIGGYISGFEPDGEIGYDRTILVSDFGGPDMTEGQARALMGDMSAYTVPTYILFNTRGWIYYCHPLTLEKAGARVMIYGGQFSWSNECTPGHASNWGHVHAAENFFLPG